MNTDNLLCPTCEGDGWDESTDDPCDAGCLLVEHGPVNNRIGPNFGKQRLDHLDPSKVIRWCETHKATVEWYPFGGYDISCRGREQNWDPCRIVAAVVEVVGVPA